MIIHKENTINHDGKHASGFICFGDNPAFKFTTEIIHEDLLHVFLLGYELGKAGDRYQILRTINGGDIVEPRNIKLHPGQS